MPPMIGKQIQLREFYDSDISGIREWVNNPQITSNLTDYDIFLYPHSHQESLNFLKTSQIINPQNIKLVIAELNSDEYLGQVNIFNIDWRNSRCSFDLLLKSESVFNKGIGTEVSNLLIHHIFKSMNINKIEISIHSNNHRALRMFEKLNFNSEGILKQHIFQGGAYYDVCLFSMFQSQWGSNISF